MQAVNLFSGAGGWEVGASSLDIDVTGIELNQDAHDTAVAAGHHSIHRSVLDLNPTDFHGGLIASPPCQTFSMAGKGAGRAAMDEVLAWIPDVVLGCLVGTGADHIDPRTRLVLEPLRWARRMQPEWIALEQVPPVLPIWEAMAEELRRWGYFVDTGILNAEQFGVPQTRRRAILVASKRGVALLPKPTHSRYYPRDPKRLDDRVKPWVAMAEASGWGMTERPSMTVCSSGTATGGAEPFGTGARAGINREHDAGRWSLRNGTQKNACTRPTESPAGTLFFGHQMNDVSWIAERPATPVACDPRIASPGHKCRGEECHPGRKPESQMKNSVRITIQEAAVLQTFPADYPWQGSRTSQFQQVGNAIPPLLARAILEQFA